MAYRPSYLVVLSSSCQLYSGTGTALFDWMRYAREAFDFSLLIDVGDARNFGIARRFCEREGVRLYPSPPLPQPGCPDFGVADVGDVLRSRPWRFVECVSWANSATNLAVLENRPPGAVLLFTPHTQPLDTLTGFELQHSVEPVLARMFRESDAVFVDSRSELDDRPDAAAVAPRAHHVRLGVDDAVFHHAAVEPRHQIVCLGDFAEPRKRLDLVYAAFRRCLQADPGLTLAIAGNRSLDLDAPADLDARVARHGYVELPAVVRLLRESEALLQLSDFEAFGLPIAEALCCGTPVIIPDQPIGRDVFDGLPGVTFVDRERPGEVARALRDGPPAPERRAEIARCAGERFSFAATYGRKLRIVRDLGGRAS